MHSSPLLSLEILFCYVLHSATQNRAQRLQPPSSMVARSQVHCPLKDDDARDYAFPYHLLYSRGPPGPMVAAEQGWEGLLPISDLLRHKIRLKRTKRERTFMGCPSLYVFLV